MQRFCLRHGRDDASGGVEQRGEERRRNDGHYYETRGVAASQAHEEWSQQESSRTALPHPLMPAVGQFLYVTGYTLPRASHKQGSPSPLSFRLIPRTAQEARAGQCPAPVPHVMGTCESAEFPRRRPISIKNAVRALSRGNPKRSGTLRAEQGDSAANRSH